MSTIKQLNSEWEASLDGLRRGWWTWPRHECIRSGRPGTRNYEPTTDLNHPIWDGSEKPITLLVNAEFGMGDTIQFYRFIPEVQKRVKRVLLRCDEDFTKLFPNVEVIGPEETLPKFDEMIHMMALPHALGVECISGEAYLRPYVANQALAVTAMLHFTKIGVCWSGNPFSPREEGRSIPVEMFKPWTDTGMSFFSLNKMADPPDGFLDVRGFMGNWNDTADLLTCMDLVVSVDTAVAHLAGALGVQTALLVSTQPDWRWRDKGDTTPWYDSVRIFRQKEPGNWRELLARLWAILVS